MATNFKLIGNFVRKTGLEYYLKPVTQKFKIINLKNKRHDICKSKQPHQQKF